jgi:outer membrane protein OmpA-like peptidoglycan-associated protein
MSKAKIFLASMVWLVILAIGVALYRYWYVPTVAKQEEQAAEEVVSLTTGDSKYDYHLNVGLDGFSGYAILRSPEFKRQLREQKIKIEPVDDAADYDKRLAALASGKLQLAAFPIDALLKASSKFKAMPATVVAIIDETRGADAVLAYSQRFPNVESLKAPETKFVLVADSPSDTLTRLLMSQLLGKITPKAIDSVANEKELVNRFRKSSPSGNEVFVTWEPVVSMLANDQVKVVFSSKDQSGFLVDALVVNRDFMLKNGNLVREVLAAYFRSLYFYSNPTAGSSSLKQWIAEDAEAGGTKLSADQVENLVKGIQWKHTLDNFAHFGIEGSATHIEDMIDKIRNVLVASKAMEVDPTQGDAAKLFNQSALKDLQSSGFHAGTRPEKVQQEVALPALNEKEWGALVHVATLEIPPLVFARGTATLTGRSESILDELSEQLKSFPRYYLSITGNAGSKGDLEANRELAKQRASAALQYLQTKGISPDRMRSMPGEVTGEISVTFRLGQVPY